MLNQNIVSSKNAINETQNKRNTSRGYRFIKDIQPLENVDNKTCNEKQISFNDLLENESKKEFISTTIYKLDNHPAIPGLHKGTITEFVGYPDVNKTQVCYKILVNLLIKDPTAFVLYLTTAGAYSSESIEELIRQYTEDYLPVLKRIYVVDITTLDDLLIILTSLKQDFLKNKMVQLLIVDPIFTYFKTTQNMNSRINHTHVVQEFVRSLKELAVLYQFPLVFTNSLTTKNETQIKCYLGEHYTEFIDLRVLLGKNGDCIIIIPPIGKI